MKFKKLEVWIEDSATESHCDELHDQYEDISIEFTEFDNVIEAKCINNTVLTSLFARASMTKFAVEFERNSIKISGMLNTDAYKNVPAWWILLV